MKNWFKGLSSKGKTIAIVVASLLTVSLVGAINNPQPIDTGSHQDNVTTQKVTPPKPTTEVKQVTEDQVIPFETSTVDDATLAQDTTVVQSDGQDGSQSVVYEVTYKDGKEVSRHQVSSTVTKQPTAKVIRHGTQSCSNGTYVNSDGNTVCSPYESSSVPAGATAQCADGSYSFSQHRSGTCSHHGGVAVWY